MNRQIALPWTLRGGELVRAERTNDGISNLCEANDGGVGYPRYFEARITRHCQTYPILSRSATAVVSPSSMLRNAGSIMLVFLFFFITMFPREENRPFYISLRFDRVTSPCARCLFVNKITFLIEEKNIRVYCEEGIQFSCNSFSISSRFPCGNPPTVRSILLKNTVDALSARSTLQCRKQAFHGDMCESTDLSQDRRNTTRKVCARHAIV